MVDIHMHVLFGVDDGPETLEETMQLLETSKVEGITDVISTSHALHPHYHVPAEKVKSQLHLLEYAIEETTLPIALHSGHEVRLCIDLVEKVKKGTVLPLAGSNYLLVELPSGAVPLYTTFVINELLKENIIPIIAHPERNQGIAEKPERLARLIRAGALSQITAGSVTGHFGKKIQKISLQLIQSNLVHFYGSDAHNTTTRPLLFQKGLHLLEKKKLGEYADLMLTNNENILLNEQMIILELEEQMATKKWLFF